MKISFRVFLILFCVSSQYAQEISGVVIDSNSQQPIEGASIYFDNTTIGTTSNAKGEFFLSYKTSINTALVVSFLGYEKQQLKNYKTGKPLKISLIEEVSTLNEVLLYAKDKVPRSDKLDLFRKFFIGTSKNAKSCDILNENDLVFRLNRADSTLIAYSEKPIVIRNKKLEYLINYDLQEFKIKCDIFEMHEKERLYPHAFYYSGTAFFKDEKESTRNKILNRRDNAYKGSVLHFMRALLVDSLKTEGYKLYYHNEEVKPLNFISKYPTENPAIKKVRFFKPLHIVYSSVKKDKNQVSSVEPNDTYFYLNNYGNYFPINALSFSGYMGYMRMGDTLPLDYMPLE